jgi:hypothetical protein
LPAFGRTIRSSRRQLTNRKPSGCDARAKSLPEQFHVKNSVNAQSLDRAEILNIHHATTLA